MLHLFCFTYRRKTVRVYAHLAAFLLGKEVFPKTFTPCGRPGEQQKKQQKKDIPGKVCTRTEQCADPERTHHAHLVMHSPTQRAIIGCDCPAPDSVSPVAAIVRCLVMRLFRCIFCCCCFCF